MGRHIGHTLVQNACIEHSAGLEQCVICKVLTAQSLVLGKYIFRAKRLHGSSFQLVSNIQIVDQGRYILVSLQLCAAAHICGNRLGNLGNALENMLVHLDTLGTDGHIHFHMVADDIVGSAAVNCAYTDNHPFNGIDLSGSHKLNIGIHPDSHSDGIHTGMGLCSVGGFAVQMQLKATAAGTVAGAVDEEMTALFFCVDVAGDDFIHAIHKTGVTDGLCTAQDLLGRLEDKLHTALDILFHSFQRLDSTQQHSRMGIVAAGMHFAGMGRCIAKAGFFLDGQRIIISADGDGLAAHTLVQGGNNTGLTNFRGVRHTDGIQFSGNNCGRLGQIKADFRDLMQLPVKLYNIIFINLHKECTSVNIFSPL